jgi:hypothetical protein
MVWFAPFCLFSLFKNCGTVAVTGNKYLHRIGSAKKSAKDMHLTPPSLKSGSSDSWGYDNVLKGEIMASCEWSTQAPAEQAEQHT